MHIQYVNTVPPYFSLTFPPVPLPTFLTHSILSFLLPYLRWTQWTPCPLTLPIARGFSSPLCCGTAWTCCVGRTHTPSPRPSCRAGPLSGKGLLTCTVNMAVCKIIPLHALPPPTAWPNQRFCLSCTMMKTTQLMRYMYV